MECCWTETSERVRVYWLENQTASIKENIEYRELLQKGKRKCSTLTISKVTKENSGVYICAVVVEIPFISLGKGNGTIITVLDKESTGDNVKVNTAGSK